MLSFANAGELFTFCEMIWDADADPDQLADLALSDYVLGDYGWAEEEEPIGYLHDFFFRDHGDIYFVLGEDRMNFPLGFPLFKVLSAAHPRTPHPTLKALTEQGDPEVLWAVAGNPAAGDELLVELLEMHPQAVIETDIQGLADPWVDDRYDAFSIRYGNDMPWELTGVPVAASVAGNRSIHADLLEWFCQADHPDLAKALILRNGDRLSDAQWRRLLDGSSGRDRDSGGWKQWIANSPHMPESLIEELLTDPYEGPVVARRLAIDPETDERVLRLLLTRGVDEGTRVRIAGHQATAPDILKVLALDPSPKVRKQVAENSSADDATRALAAISL